MKKIISGNNVGAFEFADAFGSEEFGVRALSVRVMDDVDCAEVIIQDGENLLAVAIARSDVGKLSRCFAIVKEDLDERRIARIALGEKEALA